MPHTIAVAGKGGVGKTTTCGIEGKLVAVRYARENNVPFFSRA